MTPTASTLASTCTMSDAVNQTIRPDLGEGALELLVLRTDA